MSTEASTEALPVISANRAVQAHYEACRRAGTSHGLAEMFALGQPPMSNTDREFLEGHCNGNQFVGEEAIGDLYKQEAGAAGVSTTGKVYLAGLAAFPGDPEAWVSGRGDVQRVCEARGYDADGAVTVRAAGRHRERRADDPREVTVADDILDREVQAIVEHHPEPQTLKREELKEQVRAKRKPRWAK